MSMSSRERVLCAIEHRKPDRVPADFEGNAQVIERGSYDLSRVVPENHVLWQF